MNSEESYNTEDWSNGTQINVLIKIYYLNNLKTVLLNVKNI